ncbi:MAG: ATP-binding protein [Acidimicrobiales bacterium]
MGTTRSSPRRVPLVGRGPELAILEAELRRAATGEMRCVLVVADPGMGKTRLVSELLHRQRRWTLGLSARGYAMGTTSPFGLWSEAIEAHLRKLDPPAVAELCGGFLDDLGAVFRSAAVARVGTATEVPRARLFDGIAVLVANLAAATPTVVFLDDLHLADSSSLELLDYLTRTLGGSRLLVVAAARPAELESQPLVRETLGRLDQAELLDRVHLRPLGPDHVAELAGLVLDAPAPQPLVDWLVERSRGHPLFVLGLLRALVDGGGDLTAPQLARLPDQLGEQVGNRLTSLAPAELAVLELLAVHGQRIDVWDLIELSGQPLDRLACDLETLAGVRLVTEDQQGAELAYEIAHPLIQEAIYQRIGGARRQLLHRQIARRLESAGHLAAAAPHFVASAGVGDGEAIEALLAAMGEARAHQAHWEAFAVLAQLLAILPEGDPRWLGVLEILVWQGDQFLDHKADIDDVTIPTALERIDRFLGQSGNGQSGDGHLQARGDARYCRAHHLAFDRGELVAARTACQEAISLYRAAGAEPRLRAGEHELSWIAGFGGSLPEQEALAAGLVARSEAAGDQEMVILALSSQGYAAFLRGRFAAAETALRRSTELAQQAGHTQRVVTNLSIYAQSLAFAGRLDQATLALADARSSSSVYVHTLLLDATTRHSWLAGDFEPALLSAKEAIRSTAASLGKRRAWAIAVAAMAAAEMGRLGDAHTLLDQAQAAYGSGEWYTASHHCPWAAGVLAHLDGDAARAVDLLRHTADRLAAMDARPLSALVLADGAEIAAAAGDDAATVELGCRLAETAGELEGRLYSALAALGTAWAALASCPSDAAAAASKAVEELAASGYKGFQARAAMQLGRALASTDRAGAAAAVGHAATLFENCGAVTRRQGALDLLAGLGHPGKRTRAATLGPAALSRREREVAGLAVEGLSTKEIARRLFIGERTVETHLENAYAKLGVRSRLDLVRRASEFGL